MITVIELESMGRTKIIHIEESDKKTRDRIFNLTHKNGWNLVNVKKINEIKKLEL